MKYDRLKETFKLLTEWLVDNTIDDFNECCEIDEARLMIYNFIREEQAIKNSKLEWVEHDEMRKEQG